MSFIKKLKRALKRLLDEEDNIIQNQSTVNKNRDKLATTLNVPKDIFEIQTALLKWRDGDGYEWDTEIQTSHWIDGVYEEIIRDTESQIRIKSDGFSLGTSTGHEKDVYVFYHVNYYYKTKGFKEAGRPSFEIRLEFGNGSSLNTYTIHNSYHSYFRFDKGVVPNNLRGRNLVNLKNTKFVIRISKDKMRNLVTYSDNLNIIEKNDYVDLFFNLREFLSWKDCI